MKQRWNLSNQVTRYFIVYVCAIRYFIVKWKYIIIIIRLVRLARLARLSN